MCLVLLALDTAPGYRLVLGANRDEYHARPAEPLHWWPERPQIAGGRDTRAGGTWMGVRSDGRFATVLNAPGRPVPPAAPSRGELVPGFLDSDDCAGYMVDTQARAARYAGFHLLAGQPDGISWYVGPDHERPAVLGAGLHGVDNAGLDADDPRLRRAMQDFLVAASDSDTEALFRLLADSGEPGPGSGDCRPVFICDPVFGTRCSTVLRIAVDGLAELVERRFDAFGRLNGETRFRWRLDVALAEPE